VTADDVKFTIDLHARPDDRVYKLNGSGSPTEQEARPSERMKA